MTAYIRSARRVHGDGGSALVIALVFISLFGLFTAALLTYGFAGEHTQSVVTGARDSRYAADGAIDGAVQRFKKMREQYTNPCAAPGVDPANFFTYTVHGHAAHAACTVQTLGGTPNPPQSLLPTVADSSDFYAYNTTTSVSLLGTVQYLEASGATGTVARTDYVHPNLSTITFSGYSTANLAPPTGGVYQQVQATVSHKEGDGPGCCPSQDQSITVDTSDSGGAVSCGTYNLNDWRATGGPSWPSPPYEVLDLTYKSGQAGSAVCLNTPERVQNARITYNSHNSTCGGRTITGVSTTSGSTAITSATGNFTSNDVVSPRASLTGVGNPAFLQSGTKIAAVTDATHAVLDRAATATVTNRSATLGTVCGSVNDVVDGIGLCVCLSSRPTQAASSIPVCNPLVGQDDAWQVNHGNLQLGNKDCTNGNGSTPKDGIFAAGDPTLVGGTTCLSATCPQNTHSRWQAADADVSHAIQLSHFTFDAVSTVDFVSLRVSHAEEAANMAITVTMNMPGCGPISIPNNNTGAYVASQVLLPDECAPKSAAAMDNLVMTYTVTCTAIPDSHGNPACKPGVKPYAYLDAIVLDLNYELGGSGGAPVVGFAATSGSTSVSATAQYNTDGSVSVGGYHVT